MKFRALARGHGELKPCIAPLRCPPDRRYAPHCTDDLERAHDPLRVGRCDGQGPSWIALDKFRIERWQPFGGKLRHQRCAPRGIARRDIGQPMFQRPKIKAAAPDQNRHAPAAERGIYRQPRVLAKRRRRVAFRDAANIYETVRQDAAFTKGGFGRTDIESAVDLGGIDADNLDGQEPAQRKHSGSLARPCRPHEEHDRRDIDHEP